MKKETSETIESKIISLMSSFSPLREHEIALAIDANSDSVRARLYLMKDKGQVGKSRTEEYWYLKNDGEVEDKRS